MWWLSEPRTTSYQSLQVSQSALQHFRVVKSVLTKYAGVYRHTRQDTFGGESKHQNSFFTFCDQKPPERFVNGLNSSEWLCNLEDTPP